MKDIPLFTTDFGIASIILKEIPYRAIAYIRVRSLVEGQIRGLVDECVGFCRAAGAERVFAAGHEDLELYPYHNSVLSMSGPGEYDSEASLWPVTEETVKHWREIYNEKMGGIDNASTMTFGDGKGIVSAAGTYFVHDNGQLLGIGWVEEGKLLSVASVVPGAGERCVKALLSRQSEARVELEVASTNQRAIRLYEKLGFLPTGELSRWYKVL